MHWRFEALIYGDVHGPILGVDEGDFRISVMQIELPYKQTELRCGLHVPRALLQQYDECQILDNGFLDAAVEQQQKGLLQAETLWYYERDQGEGLRRVRV